MSWKIVGTRVGTGVAVRSPFLDAWVMTMGSAWDSFFANFIHEPAMERPGATRGGKRKPFLEAGG
jgi:hypothetical protein